MIKNFLELIQKLFDSKIIFVCEFFPFTLCRLPVYPLHNVEKWPNVLLNYCDLLTARLLKYVWPFSILCVKDSPHTKISDYIYIYIVNIKKAHAKVKFMWAKFISITENFKIETDVFRTQWNNWDGTFWLSS